jgi:histidinol-phosphatase
MGRRWWAAKGLGAFADGRRVHVSEVASLDEAQVCVTFSSGWDALGLTDELVQLQQRSYRARGFGDFWQHMLVAEGAVDLAIDAVGLQPYDLAAVMVVVEEAGGTFTDRHGERTFEHDTAISSNGHLHQHARMLA